MFLFWSVSHSPSHLITFVHRIPDEIQWGGGYVHKYLWLGSKELLKHACTHQYDFFPFEVQVLMQGHKQRPCSSFMALFQLFQLLALGVLIPAICMASSSACPSNGTPSQAHRARRGIMIWMQMCFQLLGLLDT